MKRTLPLFVFAAMAAAAMAQPAPDEHSGHHPDAIPSAAAVPAPKSASPAGDGFAEQMAQMQDMHRRLQGARTAAERQALMGEHMKLMQSGMEMMARMGRPAAASPPSAGPAPNAGNQMGGMGMGMGGMGDMMGMHGTMERRMAMMEQMMQMMVDRAAVAPRP